MTKNVAYIAPHGLGDLVICADAIKLCFSGSTSGLLLVNAEVERDFALGYLLPSLDLTRQPVVLTLQEFRTYKVLVQLMRSRLQLIAWQPGVSPMKLGLALTLLSPVDKLHKYFWYLFSYAKFYRLSKLKVHKRDAAMLIVQEISSLLSHHLFPLKARSSARGIDYYSLENSRSSARYALIAPGSTPDESHKRMTISTINQVAEMLRSRFGLQSCVLIGPSEGDLLSSFLDLPSQLGSESLSPEINLVKVGSFDELSSAIDRSRVVICACNFYGHYAAFRLKPVVGLYGPTDPNITGLRGPQTGIIASDLCCSPCYSENNTSGCLNPECMSRFTSNQLERLAAIVSRFLV